MNLYQVKYARILAGAGSLMFLLAPLHAQIQRPNPVGGAGTTPVPASAPNSPPPGVDMPGPLNSNRTGPILLTGKVVLNDGTAPSDPVRIERVCAGDRSGGRPHAEGFTDQKGRFTITLGQERDIMADASETQSRGDLQGLNSRGLTQTDLMTCELRAVLPGFTSDTVSLGSHRYLDNPDVGTIVLHRMANVEGLTTSATSALAPKDARKAYEKGMDLTRKNKPDDAQKEFEKAVASYPRYAAAWFELGVLYEHHDQIDEARKAYSQSIAADSKYINPYERLYMLGAKEKNWKDVADTTDRVMHLNPFDFPGAFYFNAVANFELGNLDTAEKSGREAVKVDKNHQNPRTNYVLGIILAKKGQFAPAVECLRAYLDAVPNAPDAGTVREQIAQLEKSAGGHPQ